MSAAISQQLDQIIPRNLDTNGTLRGVYVAHFLLVTITLFGNFGGATTAYAFYNALFLLSLLWAMNTTDNEFALTKALFVNVAAIVFDIVVLSGYESSWFPLVTGIINLLFRLISSAMLWRIRNDRGRQATDFNHANYQDPTPGFGGPADYSYDMPPPATAGAGSGARVHDTKPIHP